MPPSANIYAEVSIRKCLCTERALTVPLIDLQTMFVLKAGLNPTMAQPYGGGFSPSANIYAEVSIRKCLCTERALPVPLIDLQTMFVLKAGLNPTMT